MPDLDLQRLREIAEKARPDDWEDEFWDSFPPAVILQLLDEIDRLKEEAYIASVDTKWLRSRIKELEEGEMRDEQR